MNPLFLLYWLCNFFMFSHLGAEACWNGCANQGHSSWIAIRKRCTYRVRELSTCHCSTQNFCSFSLKFRICMFSAGIFTRLPSASNRKCCTTDRKSKKWRDCFKRFNKATPCPLKVCLWIKNNNFWSKIILIYIILFWFFSELANLLNKLHGSFVILAAQLQSTHEAVKVFIFSHQAITSASDT